MIDQTFDAAGEGSLGNSSDSEQEPEAPVDPRATAPQRCHTVAAVAAMVQPPQPLQPPTDIIQLAQVSAAASAQESMQLHTEQNIGVGTAGVAQQPLAQQAALPDWLAQAPPDLQPQLLAFMAQQQQQQPATAHL